MIVAAMNFFNDHGMNAATKALDDLIFADFVSPQVFGALFDYRIALTFLSRWKGKEVLSNPMFEDAKVCSII